MNGPILAALLAAVAVGLVTPPTQVGPPPPARTRPGHGTAASQGVPAAAAADPPGVDVTRARIAGAVAALAVFLMLGGASGALGGVLVALAVPRIASRLESGGSRRRRAELVRSAPAVADLLCASLRAGVPLDLAVPVVARAVGSVSGEMLLAVHRRVQLGQPVESAWAGLADTPGVGGIARAVARSHRTGAPLSDVLGQAARDLRADALASSLAQVRAAGVRAVLPLGLCLLPAFVLLGIVPIVGGLLPSL